MRSGDCGWDVCVVGEEAEGTSNALGKGWSRLRMSEVKEWHQECLEFPLRDREKLNGRALSWAVIISWSIIPWCRLVLDCLPVGLLCHSRAAAYEDTT